MLSLSDFGCRATDPRSPWPQARCPVKEATARAELTSIIEGRAPQAQVQITRDTVESIDQVKGSSLFRLS